MDKVKLYPQERLDLDDTRALQTLVYDYVAEALGGLFGHLRGLLSVPTVTQTENNGAPYIVLSPFQFATTTPIEGSALSVTDPATGDASVALHQHKSVIVTYDASEENSAQISIDTARAYHQDYVGAKLWARPVYVATDQATRVQWSVAGGAEQTFSATTRESQRVEFAVQVSEPAYAAGEAKWAGIAEIVGWSDADNTDSLAQWQMISAYDHDDARRWFGSVLSADGLTSSQTSLATPTTSMNAYPVDASLRSYRGFGIADQLAILRYKIAQMQGHGVGDPAGTPTNRQWWQEPLVSLNGADTAIDNTNTAVDTLSTQRTTPIVCIATSRVRGQYVIGNLDYEYFINDAPYGYGIQQVRASNIRTNRICVELTAELLAQPWHIVSVVCTHLVNRTDHGQNQHDYNRVTFHPDLGPESGITLTYLDHADAYHLDDYATTSGRGVNVEMLQHYDPNEERIVDQHAGNSHANLFIGETAADNLFMDFTVSIFAIHESQY